MRLYKAKKDMEVTPTTTVFEGTLFFIDSSVNLPDYCNEPHVLQEYWQELVLHNNYGSIQIRDKI